MTGLLFLGVGTPTPAKDSFGSAAVLNLGTSRIMVDCGPAATRALANNGFSPLDVDWLFLTHLHFDHCADLPCLLLAYWDQTVASSTALRVRGPVQTKEFVARLIGENGAFIHDIEARINAPISQNTYINRGGSLPRPHPDFDVDDLSDHFEEQLEQVYVRARTTEHANPWLNSLAYRFDCLDGSVTFTGDTGSVDVIVDLAEGCDLLVANCWNAVAEVRSDLNDRSLATVQTAATMAARAGVKKLCLSHMGTRTGQQGTIENAEILERASAIFEGEVCVAREGDVLHF